MEGIEKPHTDKYKELTNNWNYDANCKLTSLPVWDFENFKRLIFVVQSVPFPHLSPQVNIAQSKPLQNNEEHFSRVLCYVTRTFPPRGSHPFKYLLCERN
jgi:hypothetical protein